MSAVAAIGAPVFDRRRFGVLLHPSSLPGSGWQGDLGDDARRFVDMLVQAGATVWQVLPLGPPGGGSPYNSRSAHAGDQALISLADIARKGWLTQDQVLRGVQEEGGREAVLRQAYSRFLGAGTASNRSAFDDFKVRHAAWLADYALYQSLKAEYGNAPWWEWPRALRLREPAALFDVRETGDYDYYSFEQYVFFDQWLALRAYAHARGLRFFGDMPIFVAEDSADVWAHTDLFVLDSAGRPEIVTGVPPDYFAANGQRWGNPHYRWQRMAADGFAWWRDRVRTQRELFDWIRIDHFRGFESAWAIPFSEKTAVVGEWIPVPGDALLSALQQEFGDLPLVAEDLGLITEAVYALRDRYGLPGMRVLQFAFDGDSGNPHLPHNYSPNSVAYTGTHDNDTTRGWYEGLTQPDRARVHEYLGRFDEAVPWPFMRATLASVARLAVIPWQDALGLGGDARMNTPGTSEGNWGFRFHWEDVPADLPARLRAVAALYGRTVG